MGEGEGHEEESCLNPYRNNFAPILVMSLGAFWFSTQERVDPPQERWDIRLLGPVRCGKSRD